MPMPTFRMLSAALLTTVVAAGCDASGEHNVPDEAEQGVVQRDSLADGTAILVAPPPLGTVNPAAASGPDSIPGAPGELNPQSPPAASPGVEPGSAPGEATQPGDTEQQMP